MYPRTDLAWLEVEPDAITANCAAVVDLMQGLPVMAMVKADGYGHGLVIAAMAALAGGATWLGVTSIAEACALRQHDIAAPILNVAVTPQASLADAISHGVDITVVDTELLQHVFAAATTLGQRARVHIKLDTGMGRLGAPPAERASLLSAVESSGSTVDVIGVYTHFASSDDPDVSLTHAQHKAFVEASAPFLALAPDAVLHSSNSHALLRFPDCRDGLVRLGIAMYGYTADTARDVLSLRTALSMFSQVLQVKMVAAGDTVSYNNTWVAPKPSLIATVGAGYADGILRSNSNRGIAMVNGVICPMVGRVTMDLLMLDVSAVDGVHRGGEVLLFGTRDGSSLPADAVADRIGTLPHELLCAAGRHLPREVRAASVPR